MKLFRNCPQEGRESCEGCPRLGRCIVRKLKRRFVKKTKAFFRKVEIKHIVFILFLVIILVIAFSDKTKSVEHEKYETNVKVLSIAIHTVANKQPKNFETTEKTTSKKERKVKKKKKTIKTEKSSLKSHTSSLKISKAEKKMIEKVVYQESRGEPYEGQVAVAAVVLNRYKFNKKQKSIEEIVTAPNQFAKISKVTQKMLDAYPKCKKAVEDAVNGEDPTKSEFSEGARYFYEPNLVSGYQKEIRKGIKVLKIGNHYFHNDFNE